VTTLGRTLFDLAGDRHPERTKVVLDAALSMSPGLLPVLHRMLPELAERGRPGIRTMRALLEERPLGYIAPASRTEGRLFELAAEASVKLVRQVDVGGSDWIGRVDAKVLPSRKLVECDSARYHMSLTDRERDAQRDADMKAVGFPDVVRIYEEIVWRQPEKAKRMLREAARP
jgi:very-short-patch-repair endonuclease